VYGSQDPDRSQNVTDPEQCVKLSSCLAHLH
jgi:hypothetical protein